MIANSGFVPSEEELHHALERIRRRLESAGGDPERITVVAVTKGFGPEAVEAVLAAGVSDVAESYAQELQAKAAAVVGPRWHFVGRLQTNKVRKLAGLVSCWQSIDRPELIDELDRRAPGGDVLVQVNVSGDPNKGGCEASAAKALVERLRQTSLVVTGLMAVGVAGDPESSRAGFRQVVRLADELELAERSMGMSGDLEVAVEEGSTMVRIGRALFGPRPAPPTAGPGAHWQPATG